MEKRAILIVKLVPDTGAYEGKNNKTIAEEMQTQLTENPAIPYVAEVERISVFDSPAQEGDTGVAYKQAVTEVFKTIHKALEPALNPRLM